MYGSIHGFLGSSFQARFAKSTAERFWHSAMRIFVDPSVSPTLYHLSVVSCVSHAS